MDFCVFGKTLNSSWNEAIAAKQQHEPFRKYLLVTTTENVMLDIRESFPHNRRERCCLGMRGRGSAPSTNA